MKAAAVQTRPRFGDRKGNVERALALMDRVEADLFVLPELFGTGYLFTSREELHALSEPRDGETVSALLAYTARRGCAVYGGFAERGGERLYNTAVLAAEGEAIAFYRKLHLFSKEKEIFDTAQNPPVTAEWRGTRLGLMVCFDWIFPEMARTLALDGAQVLLLCANLVLPWCQQAMVTRSLENGVFTVLANRVGTEERGGRRLAFTGGSGIVGPRGEVLARASADGEEVIVAEIDPARADDKMVTEDNHLLRDRRADRYRL